jgi:hypothetical protein
MTDKGSLLSGQYGSLRNIAGVLNRERSVVVSNLTLDELELAPNAARNVLADLCPVQVER